MEERIAFKITPAHHDEIKRLIRLAAPNIKSSHCAEAVARGFGFKTNAALIAELKTNGIFESKLSRLSFEAFLAERGLNPERLQVSLFTDATRIATKRPWKPLASYDTIHFPSCMTCLDPFGSSADTNRICGACNLRTGRTPGFNLHRSTLKSIHRKAFTEGWSVEEWSHLRVRPGWSDFLASAELRSEVGTLIEHRHRALGGDFTNMPDRVIDIFAESSFLDITDEMGVAQKTAETWWLNGKADPLGDFIRFARPQNRVLGSTNSKVLLHVDRPVELLPRERLNKGTAVELTTWIASNIGDGTSWGAEWKGRVVALLFGVMQALVYLRDHKGNELDVNSIRDNLTIERYVKLAWNIVRSDAPESVRRPVSTYLEEAGYIDGSGSDQTEAVVETHEYLQAMISAALGAVDTEMKWEAFRAKRSARPI